MKNITFFCLTLALILGVGNIQAKEFTISTDTKTRVWEQSSTPEGFSSFYKAAEKNNGTMEVKNEGVTSVVLKARYISELLVTGAKSKGLLNGFTAEQYANFALRYNGMVKQDGCIKSYITPAEFMARGQTGNGWQLPLLNTVEAQFYAMRSMLIDVQCQQGEFQQVENLLKSNIARNDEYIKQYGTLRSSLYAIRDGQFTPQMLAVMRHDMEETFGPQFAQIDHDIKNLSEQITAQAQRINAIENDLSAVVKDVKGLRTDVTSLGDKVSGMESKIGGLGTGMDNVNNQILYLQIALGATLVLLFGLAVYVFTSYRERKLVEVVYVDAKDHYPPDSGRAARSEIIEHSHPMEREVRPDLLDADSKEKEAA